MHKSINCQEFIKSRLPLPNENNEYDPVHPWDYLDTTKIIDSIEAISSGLRTDYQAYSFVEQVLQVPPMFLFCTLQFNSSNFLNIS